MIRGEGGVIQVNRIDAFVGHSFLEEDRVVVSHILTMLDDVVKLVPGFSWEHAEEAEAKRISSKVFERMEGKNVFIGICSARERAAGMAAVRVAPWYFFTKRYMISHETIETKASDWVIQEIGFALGRGLTLLLLVEDGVRKPGGLQGDLEWISFRRDAPREAFSKLAEMLSKLVPATTPLAESSPPPAVESAIEQETDVGEWITPTPAWTEQDYIMRYQFCLYTDRSEAALSIVRSFQESVLARDEEKRAQFEASRVAMESTVRKLEWQQPLERLAKQYPTQPAPLQQLASQFKGVGQNAKAAELYGRAAELAGDSESRISLLRLSALAFSDVGGKASARKVATSIGLFAKLGSPTEAAAMGALADIWKALGENELFIACAEMCVELAPTREEPRFGLAYLYRERGKDAESMFDYRKLLKSQDSSAARSNVGVSAAALKLPATAVDNYRAAEAAGNSLAKSNLAHALLSAGFVDQAEALCREGLQAKDPHPNLPEALASVLRAREAEGKRESELLSKIESSRRQWNEVAQASVRPALQQIAPNWSDGSHELKAEISGSKLTIEGTFVRSTIGGLMLSLGAAPRNEQFVRQYVFEMTGEAGVGTVEDLFQNASAAISLLGKTNQKRSVVCVVSQMDRTMSIYGEGENSVCLTTAGSP